ncbi:MAG: type IV secretory system conjugative DNA transfer family protein [Christensenellaceae bacterium]|jgi:type IV secretion system protein VirD4|nr:type IV secretory system conjugative DNA transfer family protein [Christensenellaceae bacterium]
MNIAKVSAFLKRRILPNLPYVLIFWFANKMGEAYRMASGADFLQRLTRSMSTLGPVMQNPLPSFDLFDLAVGLAGAAIIFGVVAAKKKNAKKYRKNVEYGSARWAGPEDIAPFMDSKPENNIILTQTEGLTMNPRPANPKHARNKNMLVIGGSGSGKTRFVIKPNLMMCRSKDYPVSFVVTDPKGSLVVECGRMLRRHGYRIKVLNTVNFDKSHHYNPFAYIHSEADILKLVTTLIVNTKGEGQGGDPFWTKAETLLYTALIAYLHYESPEAEQNFATLAEMIGAMEVREEDESFKNIVDLMFDALEEKDPEHFAVRQYRKFKLAAGKTLKSILISAGSRLAVFDIGEIRELTRYDELALDTLGDEKTALFLIMSDTSDHANFLLSICYTQLFNLLCEKADNVYGGRLPVHVRCLIDEAANIGQIPRLEKLMATIRSREISACLVLQAQSQLKAIYKDHADTIVGNCDSAIFLGGKEKTTLEEWSKLLGRETIDTYSNSETKGNSPSFGKNYQKLGKDLMSVDELAVMDGSMCVLQLRGVRPFLSKKYDITKHTLYKQLSDYDKRNAFDVQKHLSTRLAVRADDEFEVYGLVPLVPPGEAA